jgi:ribosome biogenesis GTPase
VVRDGAGAERVCHLAGQACVVGDAVRWLDTGDGGGRVVAVTDRTVGTLVRRDRSGREEVLATGLAGLFVVVAPQPPTWSGAVDRFLVAAAAAGVEAVVVLNKVDLEVPPDLIEELEARVRVGVTLVRTSARRGDGVAELAERARASGGPWSLVGPSGAGKTSLVGALLPGVEVGGVAELSAYWGTGRHTTTGARRFDLPGGGSIVDAPGIRTFLPDLPDSAALRRGFPGVRDLTCRYRDCGHRPAEDGCAADALPASLLQSYRRMLSELDARGGRR